MEYGSYNIEIENIDGSFHIFNQFGTPIIFHAMSLWTAVFPKDLYESILAGAGKDAVYAAVETYIRNSFGMEPITRSKSVAQMLPSITLVLTHRCNLGCPYCFDRFSGSGRMEYSTAVQALRSFVKQHRAFRVVFFGGEPLLEFSLIKRIVGFCEGLCMEGTVDSISYCITTNGTVLNETMVQFFNAYGFDVTLSVDGVFSHSLNQIIGCPPKILHPDFIMLYMQLKKLYIRVTVYPHVVNHMRELYMELSGLKPLAIAFSPIMDDGFSFSKTDELNWKRQLEGIIYYRAAGACGCRVNKMDALANCILQKLSIPHCCGAGKNNFAIDADGKKYPCHRFVGKINAASAVELNGQIDKKCLACWAYYICNGNCNYCKKFEKEQIFHFLCNNFKKEVELACWLAVTVQIG